MIFHAFNIPTPDEDTQENIANRSEKAELLRDVKEAADRFIRQTDTTRTILRTLGDHKRG